MMRLRHVVGLATCEDVEMKLPSTIQAAGGESAIRFAFLLKTYRDDLHYVDRLIESFHRHNVDSLTLFVTAPQEDVALFQKYAQSGVRVIADESITDELVQAEVAGIRPGYINQEIIKLAFAETGMAHNYMCLDSDGVFLRDFRERDFMFDDETPYTVMFEDNELRLDPEYFEVHWTARYEALERIRIEVGLTPQPILTCHGFAIFSSEVLHSMKATLMEPRKLTYASLLEIAPYEFSWYTLYLQASGVIPIHPRESYFRYVHSPRQLALLALSGTTTDDLARGYIGVTVNSNFSRDFGLADADQPLHQVLGRYVAFRDLGRAAVVRFRVGVQVVSQRVRRRITQSK